MAIPEINTFGLMSPQVSNNVLEKNKLGLSANFQDNFDSALLNEGNGKELPSASQLSEYDLEHQGRLNYLQKYIQSHGAPEELEQRRIVDLDKIFDEDEETKIRKNRKFNPNALETISQTLQDPENEDQIKVVVSKIDEEGKAKITRVISFNSGDGNKNEKDKRDFSKNESNESESEFKSVNADKDENIDSV